MQLPIVIAGPDTRGWVALGLFALTAGIFGIICWKPEMTSNQGFMFLAQAVIVTGLINGVITFLFGASKGAAEANARADAAIAKLPDAKP